MYTSRAGKLPALLCFLVVCALLLSAATTGAQAWDPCAATRGELRRVHDCASVIQKGDVCCWKRRDGVHGELPKSCCGSGWEREDCARIVEDRCETHHEEL